jgi:DNA-binding CsgD family transcriptional regulator
VEWLTGAAHVITDTPFWHALVTVQDPLLQQIRACDWSAVSPWHLVHHLKVLGDIRTGVETFLPDPYRAWPAEVRQELFLALFLIHGAAAIEDNPLEDFGLPELAHLPVTARAVLPAVRPLWHMLAQPAVVAAIRYHRERHVGGDNGILALLHEVPKEMEFHWISLLRETPGELLARLDEYAPLQKADWNFHTGRHDNIPSEVFITLQELRGDQRAGEVLARALMGECDQWLDRAAERLRTERRTARQQEPLSDALRIRFGDTDKWQRGEIGEAALPTTDPTALDRLTRRDEMLRPSIDQRVRGLLDDPKLNNKLRHLLQLLRQKPDQSVAALAHQLGTTPQTVRNYLAKIRKLLQ